MLKAATTLLSYAVTLVSLAPSFCQEPPVTLEIQVPESSFIAGTSIRLDVVVKNMLKEDLLVWKADPKVDGEADAYVYVEVLDSAGNPLPRIDYVRVERDGKTYTVPKIRFTRKGVFVAPDQELHDFLLLSSLFDLSKPGTYSVSAVLETPMPNSGPNPKLIKAESNKVSFYVYQKGSQ